VRDYAGIIAAGDESGASIGLGYLAEFYIDFGVLGVIALASFWGFCGGAAMALLAKASPSPQIFVALVIVLFTQYFMSFEGSFIKLFAGAVQRTLIAAAVFGVSGRIAAHRMQWISGKRQV
jgi:oligosaccharide repeat unit polymerase